MLKITVTSLIILLLVYLCLCALLFVMQKRLLYFPTVPVESDDAQEIWLQNDDENIKIWHIAEKSDQALIYFGGNAEDVAENIPRFGDLFPNHSIYLMNYRGFGGSSGSPTEQGIFSDAQALYEYIAQRHDHITVFGRSLGTGVAMYLAALHPIPRLVLVTPYDNMTNMAAEHYPFFPVSLLLKDKYDSLSRAAEVTAETFVLIAQHDEIIPLKRTENLVAALDAEKTTVKMIPDTDHNSICVSSDYEEALASFINRKQLENH